MRAQPGPYRDLDALLQRHGYLNRRVEVDHSRGEERNASANGAIVEPAAARQVPGYLYHHDATGAQILLPLRPSDEALAPHHLHAARRTLVDWGVSSDAEFDRWLCQVQFPADDGEIVGAGANANQGRVAD